MDLCRIPAGQKADLRLRRCHVKERIGFCTYQPHAQSAGIGKIIDYRCRDGHDVAGGNLTVAVLICPTPALQAHRWQSRRLNGRQRIHHSPAQLAGESGILQVDALARQPKMFPERVWIHGGKSCLHQRRHASR